MEERAHLPRAGTSGYDLKICAVMLGSTGLGYVWARNWMSVSLPFRLTGAKAVPSSLVVPEMKGSLANLPAARSFHGLSGTRSPSTDGAKTNLPSVVPVQQGLGTTHGNWYCGILRIVADASEMTLTGTVLRHSNVVRLPKLVVLGTIQPAATAVALYGPFQRSLVFPSGAVDWAPECIMAPRNKSVVSFSIRSATEMAPAD